MPARTRFLADPNQLLPIEREIQLQMLRAKRGSFVPRSTN